MKKVLSLVFSLFLLGLLQGSAQTSKTEESAPENGKDYATLYVYRPGNVEGAIVGYELKVTYADGSEEKLGRIKNNSKFEVKLTKEGKAELWAKTEKYVSATVDVKFGESYYLKAGTKPGWAMGQPELTLVYPDQGKIDYENFGKKRAKKNKK